MTAVVARLRRGSMITYRVKMCIGGRPVPDETRSAIVAWVGEHSVKAELLDPRTGMRTGEVRAFARGQFSAENIF